MNSVGIPVENDGLTHTVRVSMTLEEAVASGVDPKKNITFYTERPFPFHSGYRVREGARVWSDPWLKSPQGGAGPLVFVLEPDLGFGMRVDPDEVTCNCHDDIHEALYDSLASEGKAPSCEHYNAHGEHVWQRVAIYDHSGAVVAPGSYLVHVDSVIEMDSFGGTYFNDADDAALFPAADGSERHWGDECFDEIRHVHSLRVRRGLLPSELRRIARVTG